MSKPTIVRVPFFNEGAVEIVIYFEPWGGGYSLAPGRSIEMVVSSEAEVEQKFSVAFRSDAVMVVYALAQELDVDFERDGKVVAADR